ncbi:hypothetical protein BVRB_022360 [Beta vulgaris subsp. vulgaris]|uniref:Cilia- and flagella-associated protein 91 n=1 Tax=Beta vulgaris subsp. vulgaris TaxID=3555 RepID=A0A0J8B3A8_BETVV|nr:hypothetical protein BVRB_022360 [Beta vulgaris subsp. vulgaris]
MQSATTGLVLSPHLYNATEEAPAELKTRTIATQSVYREESSQTAPYAPDYVYADKDNPPELFHLKDWLPADLTRISLHEIEQIEREQARRAFQAGIPPAKTEADFRHRMKLLQEREFQVACLAILNLY